MFIALYPIVSPLLALIGAFGFYRGMLKGRKKAEDYLDKKEEEVVEEIPEEPKPKSEPTPMFTADLLDKV